MEVHPEVELIEVLSEMAREGRLRKDAAPVEGRGT